MSPRPFADTADPDPSIPKLISVPLVPNHGEAEYLNRAFGTRLAYRPMSVDEYKADRIGELGEFMGTIIAGIYQGIHDGALDNPSDFETSAGRPHQSWDDYFASLRG